MARRRAIEAELGARLRAWREGQGRSLEDVAMEAEAIAQRRGRGEAHFTRAQVSKIELGAEYTPAWRFEAIAAALGYSLAELYEPFGPPAKPPRRSASRLVTA